MNIDWKRVAKPQPDAYDSRVIAQILHDEYGWVKRTPTTELTLCQGAVGVCRDRQHTIEQLDHPNNAMRDGMDYVTPERIADIDHFLAGWSDGYVMLQHFLDEFWPRWGATFTPQARGSMSGHYEMRSSRTKNSATEGLVLNAVYISVNDPQGTSEGIYHEVGHARLESLGIGIDTHDNRLLLNGPDELYDSPVRWDIKRPMSAVVQAVYSWIVFGEADLQCGLNLTGWDIKDRTVQLAPKDASAIYMIGNVPKIQDGLDEIRKYAKMTPEGVDFFDGYLEWGYDLVDRSLAFLKDVHGEEFDARYAKALEYRVARQQVLAQVAEKLKDDPSYSYGIAEATRRLAEITPKS